jgi:hypothetical protein
MRERAFFCTSRGRPRGTSDTQRHTGARALPYGGRATGGRASHCRARATARPRLGGGRGEHPLGVVKRGGAATWPSTDPTRGGACVPAWRVEALEMALGVGSPSRTRQAVHMEPREGVRLEAELDVREGLEVGDDGDELAGAARAPRRMALAGAARGGRARGLRCMAPVARATARELGLELLGVGARGGSVGGGGDVARRSAEAPWSDSAEESQTRWSRENGPGAAGRPFVTGITGAP